MSSTEDRPSVREGGAGPRPAPPSPQAEGATERKQGSLTVIGTGIRTVGQLTIEAIAWMKEADILLYVVADPIAEATMKRLNPHGATSLSGYYREGLPRIDTYHAMVEHILSCVRAEQTTVAAFYGHPGVFAYPSHESIRRLRAEGYPARMLPGISSEDCLFADLGVDPAVGGCQSYEATDFLLNAHTIDTSSQLILWQVGTLGDWTYKQSAYDLRAFPLLVQRLCELYPPWHQVIAYEAAVLPGCEPVIKQLPLSLLNQFHVNAATTLYIPPARPAAADAHMLYLFSSMAANYHDQ
jgi:uncharacterized protein YabN with tetrapyrrole methylase and pyrophosphatase domain